MKLYEADTVMGWFESWPVKTRNALTSKVWGYLPYATSWIIWKYRNNKVFNDVRPSLVKMQQEIKGIIWYWSGNWPGRKRFNFRDMTVNWVGVLAGTVGESRTATAVTGNSVLFQSSSSLQIKAPTRFSSLKSVSLSTQRAIYPSLRMRSVPLRFRVSCAAKPKTVEKVCEIVRKQLALPADSTLSAESKFSSLGADSLDTVEIVMGLEEAFGISVDEENAQSITTVQDAADMIENLLDT
ncbi:Acyl carrier protein [Thalictrum thalictroides]|uniref:Acyl carrier protein n=1 Tax=Thalictrum thalictroides TaxID=46969 RepID=A0A7J6X9L5_THATH|nr:Acyl carrier protein [Thalictrum thalictroides]